jgi:tRNA (guanine-N(7)-)-methyltransferase (EC 2.1.1.33)
MERHGADYVLDVPRAEGWTTVAPGFRPDLTAAFGREAPLVVEIGPGVGEQVVAAARRWPERDFLAFEVWQPGIAKLVSRAATAGVDNIRVIEADAAQALPIVLGEAGVDEVWTFFPDPWRKARHRKRRLVSDAFAHEVARVLVDGGVWRLATDWDDYAWQMRDVVEACPDLANPHSGERPDPQDPEPSRGGFAPRWDGRVTTHFETRGHDAGRSAHDILAVRLPRSPGGAAVVAAADGNDHGRTPSAGPAPMPTSDPTPIISAVPTSDGPTSTRSPSALTDEGDPALVDGAHGGVGDRPAPRGEE